MGKRKAGTPLRTALDCFVASMDGLDMVKAIQAAGIRGDVAFDDRTTTAVANARAAMDHLATLLQSATPVPRQPTDAQMATLRAYAAWAGRTWKDKLNQDWQRARSDFPGDYAYLQQLRNAFGPSWLITVRL